MGVQVSRLYDRTDDGVYRGLVDRLWPRGVRKADAPWDRWLKEAAPSGALRTWYHGHRDEEETFRRRYLEELAVGAGADALAELERLADNGALALLTAALDPERSHVAVLRYAIALSSDSRGRGLPAPSAPRSPGQ